MSQGMTWILGMTAGPVYYWGAGLAWGLFDMIEQRTSTEQSPVRPGGRPGQEGGWGVRGYKESL